MSRNPLKPSGPSGPPLNFKAPGITDVKIFHGGTHHTCESPLDSPDAAIRFKSLQISSPQASELEHDPQKSSSTLQRRSFDAPGVGMKSFSNTAQVSNPTFIPSQERQNGLALHEYDVSSYVAQSSSHDNEADSLTLVNDACAKSSFLRQRDMVFSALSSESRTASPSPSPLPMKEPSIVPHVHSHLDQTSGMFLQPETHPITEDQLVNEVRAIYAGLVMVEKKCIEIVKQQNEKPEELTGLQWQALTALHRTLLHEHHDFFLASNHPAASKMLKELAKNYSMPARMWRYGIHSYLELLRKRLPSSLEHMLTFIYMAYSMMTLLLHSAPAFEETWIECLGDLARYRMAIEEVDMRDREIYTGVARYWYTKAADLNPDIGRIQHHLAVLARPNLLQQLFYYSKSLVSVQPFTNARDSILLLFGPLLDPAKAATKYSKYYPRELTQFVEAHGALFTRQNVSTFITPAKQFLTQLDSHAGRIGALFREQGVYIAAANYAAIFDFGHDDARLPLAYNRDIFARPKLEIISDASEFWKIQSSACAQTGISHRIINEDRKITESIKAVSLASELAFKTLDIILERLGDKNMLPCVHISLAFLWCMSTLPEGMSYIQADVPWAHIATFLNALIKPEIDMDELLENEEFPVQHDTSISRQLPEDFLIHGLCWSQLYYPTDFFNGMAEHDERSIELPAVAIPRTQRCLWLGIRIAKFERWLVYEPEPRKFSATPFAEALAVLSGQHQVLHSGQHQVLHVELEPIEQQHSCEQDVDTSMVDV